VCVCVYIYAKSMITCLYGNCGAAGMRAVTAARGLDCSNDAVRKGENKCRVQITRGYIIYIYRSRSLSCESQRNYMNKTMYLCVWVIVVELHCIDTIILQLQWTVVGYNFARISLYDIRRIMLVRARHIHITLLRRFDFVRIINQK
jgi:hypothetical protein